MTQTVGSTEVPPLSISSFLMHPSFCISSLQERWCKQHTWDYWRKIYLLCNKIKKKKILWRFLFSFHTTESWKCLWVTKDLFPSPKSCTSALHRGGDMVQSWSRWHQAPDPYPAAKQVSHRVTYGSVPSPNSSKTAIWLLCTCQGLCLALMEIFISIWIVWRYLGKQTARMICFCISPAFLRCWTLSLASTPHKECTQ